MELLQNCRDHAHKSYGDLLVAAQKTLADSLFEQAERCSNNERHRRYVETMQQLEDNCDAMQASFVQQLEMSYQAFASGHDEESSLDDQFEADTLSLVPVEELEDQLATSVIISKSNSRNSEALWKLNRRMAVLRGGKLVSDETNPFGPAAVCTALQVSITQLSIDRKSKILAYKRMGQTFILSFAKELDTLNDMLAEKGVLPNLHFSISKAAKKTRTEMAARTQESTASITHQQELYSAIQLLQAAMEPRTHSASGVSLNDIPTNGSGGTDTFSEKDYVLALSAIQQSNESLSTATLDQPSAANLVEQKLFDQLSKQADEKSHHKMANDHADAVDLVGMIFRYMLDDPNLHDTVKSLLSHLHTPYLKLALMDKSFLDNHQHSARLLLNMMAEVASKWVKEDHNRTVLPKIKTVVENILTGFIDDISIFDRLLEDFSRFRENLSKRAGMVERRNTESQQGLEKLELSRCQAIEEVDARLDKANAPKVVADLLRKPWSDFLAFNILRHGDDSLTWQSALKVVDGVVWSVKPGKLTGSTEDLHRRQIELAKIVADDLITMGYDEEASKGLLNTLKEAHQLIHHSAVKGEVVDVDVDVDVDVETNTLANTAEQGLITTSPASQKKTTTEQQAEQTLKTKPPKISPEEQGMIDKLDEIAFGTWFEFDQEQAVTQLKLAWFSQITSRYMFVDHAGVKQAMETQLNLAKGLCAGNIRIIEPTKKSFMERALESVLDKLKVSG